MKNFKPYYFLLCIAVVPMLFIQNTGCGKEYSFEGGDTTHRDTLLLPLDTVAVTPPDNSPKEFPVCSLCNATNTLTTGDWSFTTGSDFLCGSKVTSGFIGGASRKDFTLFGPSACSIDTGIVLTAFLDVPLSEDRTNITTSHATFSYYDHNAPKDIFLSLSSDPFSITVQSYTYATGVCIGTFSGTVFKTNGSKAFIANGKFKVLVK